MFARIVLWCVRCWDALNHILNLLSCACVVLCGLCGRVHVILSWIGWAGGGAWKNLAQVSGGALWWLDNEVALRFGSLSLTSYILCDWRGNVWYVFARKKASATIFAIWTMQLVCTRIIDYLSRRTRLQAPNDMQFVSIFAMQIVSTRTARKC